LLDCQEYILDLEMSVSRAVAALKVAGLDQLQEEPEETQTKLESEAAKSREMALELRWRYLE
jgi:hypothetical protein